MSGGLISRYVVGLMYARGLFETIQPVNFTTFASPHLGIRHINPGLVHNMANILGPRLLSSSGRQMFITDRTPRPLLLRMTDKGTPSLTYQTYQDSIFIRGLALFRTRTAYANIINDRSVPYHTAAISQYDPYLDMTRLNLSYLPDYSPTILHPTHPIIPLAKPKEPTHPSTARRFLFPIALAFLIPLWTTFFVLASLYQSFFSARRIAHHLSLQEDSEVEEQTLSGAVQEIFEDVVDNAILFDPTDEQEEYAENDDDATPLLAGMMNGKGEKPVSFKREEYRLALTEDQLSMLSGLKSVAWQTFGVHIHQTMHSHAAIIRRHKWRPELKEGAIVIQHWLQTQFKV